MYCLALLYILAQSNLTAVNPLKDLFVDQPWRFVEYELLIKPTKELESWHSFAKRFIPASCAATMSFYVGNKLCNVYIPETQNGFASRAFSKTVINPIMTLVALFGSFSWSRILAQKRIEYRAFLRFIEEWPENRTYSPDQFHASCAHLHTLLTTSGESERFKDYAQEMIPLLQKQIFEHYPETYKHRLTDLETPYFTQSFFHTVVTCDIGQVLDVILKIFSAFSTKDHYSNDRENCSLRE